jgi:hypothetical protein
MTPYQRGNRDALLSFAAECEAEAFVTTPGEE